CASRGFFARASTATVMNARSGVRRTTASPVLTTTCDWFGIGLGSWAVAETDPASSTTNVSIRIHPKCYIVPLMRVEQFAMERMQSTYENQVEFNLSESGVHPLRLGELVEDAAAREALLAEGLRYTQ